MTPSTAAESSPPPEAPLELPDLQDTTLDASRLATYLDELRDSGAVVEVRVKGAAKERPRTDVSLTSLFSDLIRKQIHSAQLRYVYEGSRWVDTLMLTPSGVRLVRMEA